MEEREAGSFPSSSPLGGSVVSSRGPMLLWQVACILIATPLMKNDFGSWWGSVAIRKNFLKLCGS